MTSERQLTNAGRQLDEAMSNANPTIRFKHPERRRMLRLGVRHLLGGRVTTNPDLFLGYLIKKVAGKPFESKEQLLQALEGKVRRPQTARTHVYNPRSSKYRASALISRPRLNDHAISTVRRMLERHGTVFVKPTGFFAHGGKFVRRLSPEENGIRIEFADDRDREAFAEHAPSDARNHKNGVVLGLHAGRSLDDAIAIALSGQGGPTAVEREIAIPRYKGRKWEIRTVVQLPEGRPLVVGHFAKVGRSGSVAANIATGGRDEEATKVVMDVHRNRHPRASDQRIAALTEEFFRRAHEQAIAATNAVNERFVENLGRYITGFPKEEFHIRQAAVDITGEFNPRTGKLDPVVMEFQYPNAGFGIFKVIDPLGYQIANANYRRMGAEGRELLKRHFGVQEETKPGA